MRLIVMSDSHGALDRMRRIIESNKADAEAFLFLGDGLDDFDLLRPEYPALAMYSVRGNCDFRHVGREKELWLSFGGYEFLVCHGDRYGVKYGLGVLAEEARLRQADVALYGHTHCPRIDYIDGIYFLNPGSLAQGSYLRIDITGAGIVPILVELR